MIAFIMMGQSNMSGRGALDELPPLEPSHVFAWRDGRWEPAREPVVRDRPFSGEGMGTSFGQAVAAATRRGRRIDTVFAGRFAAGCVATRAGAV